MEIGSTTYEAPAGLVVARIDEHGVEQWRRLVAISDDHYRRILIPFFSGADRPIAVGRDGSIVIGGPFERSIDFGQGALETPHGVFLASLEADGSLKWARAFPSGPPMRIVAARMGSVFVDDAGIITWLAHMPAVDLGDGAHPAGRLLSAPSKTVPVMVIARFHPCGALLASQFVGTELQAWMAPSPSGDFFLIGRQFTYEEDIAPHATFELTEGATIISPDEGVVARLRPAGP